MLKNHKFLYQVGGADVCLGSSRFRIIPRVLIFKFNDSKSFLNNPVLYTFMYLYCVYISYSHMMFILYCNSSVVLPVFLIQFLKVVKVYNIHLHIEWEQITCWIRPNVENIWRTKILLCLYTYMTGMSWNGLCQTKVI